MAAEKSIRATKIAQLLCRESSDHHALVKELAELYPQYTFTWSMERGLEVYMPVGSIRMPQALWYVATRVTQSTGRGIAVLKDKLGVPPPEEPPPRTWHERLDDDFV